ncbi:hypothetical protein ABW21_db0200225 [Orbilia brochopaga]|nr:hypothetical protein ABW21_db0200225 [Drechslerella brochopaga]
MVVLEIALIVGGVIFLKNRKKRKAEARARQESFGPRPGSVPPHPPQNYSPYAPPVSPYAPPASPAPHQKPPVMYGATTSSGPPQSQPLGPSPAYSDHYPSYAPPAYASLQPPNNAPGRPRTADGDRKSRSFFHQS